MDSSGQPARGRTFCGLHEGPGILVLPNAWDAASARVIEEAGFPAVATTSAGIAFARGYPDGERIPRDAMLDAVRRIAAAVSVPVTADMEAGYGRAPERVAETVRLVIAAGAVGMNLEDSVGDELLDLPLQVERMRAAREAAAGTGIPFVLNARTDTFLMSAGEPATRLARGVERLDAYRDAGADCLFAIGVRDAATIGALVREVRAPVNVLAGPGSPPIPELRRLGVRRVTFGSGPMRAGLGVLRRLAKELVGPGTYESLSGAVAHDEMNRLLERDR